MSANLSFLVRRLPIQSRLGSTRLYHVSLRGGQNPCLTRFSIRWQPLLQRGYATQNNDNQKKGKNDANQPPANNKKSNENVEKEQKKNPAEQSHFEKFFGDPEGNNKQEGQKQNADKNKDQSQKDKKETIEERIERLFRESKAPEANQQNQTNANNQQQQKPNDKNPKPPPKK